MIVARDIFKIKIKLPLHPYESNVYLLAGDEGYLLVDTGYEKKESVTTILRSIRELGLNIKDLKYIINTHSHPDHVGGNRSLKQESGAKIAIHELETLRIKPTGEITLKEGDKIELNPIRLEVVHTPGHSPGHICLYYEKERLMFSGDHIIEGSTSGTVYVGPPDGNVETYLNSVKKISNLKIDTILPGHGSNIIEPHRKIREIIEHHQTRERQIIGILMTGKKNADQIAKRIYGNLVSSSLAKGAVLGRLEKLVNEEVIIQVKIGENEYYRLRELKMKSQSSN
jgi:glyoxylase-like metal-dependent hydrolase (beta-lactamase superfamily II)